MTSFPAVVFGAHRTGRLTALLRLETVMRRAFRRHDIWLSISKLVEAWKQNEMENRCAMNEARGFLNEADARRFFAGGPMGPDEQGYRDRERVEEGVRKGFDRRSRRIFRVRGEHVLGPDVPRAKSIIR